jgi:hypothetical protein
VLSRFLKKYLPVKADAFTFVPHYENIGTHTSPSFLAPGVGCWCFVPVAIKH